MVAWWAAAAMASPAEEPSWDGDWSAGGPINMLHRRKKRNAALDTIKAPKSRRTRRSPQQQQQQPPPQTQPAAAANAGGNPMYVPHPQQPKKNETKAKEESGGEGGFVGKMKELPNKAIDLEQNLQHKVEDATGAPPWAVMGGFALIVIAVLGLVGWCVFRFCRKKRPGKDKEKEAPKEDDEDALVANEEIKDEDAEEKKQEENKGKIKYKLEYDFTTQELKVTVLECSDLPPTDWSTGLTDPFVKVYLLPDKKPKYETKVHRKNLNPKFDQTFAFKNLPYVETFDKTLVFAVYDYDRFSSSDQQSELQLPLNSVDLAAPIEEWKDLAPVDDGSNQYLGDLCLSLRYVPSSGKLTVAVLEARKLKKMDITGASDPYVKIKLFDNKQKRIGKKKKTTVKSCNLNPYWNESFVFVIDEMDMKRVFLDITVCDYDLIGGGDPIGKIKLGWNQQKTYKPGFKHWKEVLENPRRPIIKWHVLQDPEPDDEDEEKKKKEKEKKEKEKKEGKDGKKDDKKDGKKDEKKDKK